MKDEVKATLAAASGSSFHLAADPSISQIPNPLDFVRPVNTTFHPTFVALMLSTMLFSSGCEKKTAATDPAAQSVPGNTKPLEAADLGGYDGKRLRKSVDHIKETNEKHTQDVEKMAGSGPDQ